MILDKFKLTDKVAIVTGANTGLGQGMCIALAEAGAKVIGVARRECKETSDKIKAFNGFFSEIIADLSTLDPIDRIIKEALSIYGRIDILVNNAGMIIREDAILYKSEDWDKVAFLNEKMVFFLSQAVAKVFIENKTKGKIINIASMLSFQGGIRVPAYAASKSAVLGITKSLATEWAQYSINVNAIAPGYMETNNTKALKADEERNKQILERIPAARWGTTEDIMGACVFLASDASDYVNGYTIAVDGGWLAR